MCRALEARVVTRCVTCAFTRVTPLRVHSFPNTGNCEWLISPATSDAAATAVAPIVLHFTEFDLFTNNIAYVEIYDGDTADAGALLGAPHPHMLLRWAPCTRAHPVPPTVPCAYALCPFGALRYPLLSADTPPHPRHHSQLLWAICTPCRDRHASHDASASGQRRSGHAR